MRFDIEPITSLRSNPDAQICPSKIATQTKRVIVVGPARIQNSIPYSSASGVGEHKNFLWLKDLLHPFVINFDGIGNVKGKKKEEEEER